MYISIAVLIGIAVLILYTSYIVYRKIFARNRKEPENLFKGLEGNLEGIKKIRREFIEQTLKIPLDPVTLTARDGKKLYGRYYRTKDDAPVAILFHGYRSMGIRDFSGLVNELITLGHNIIIADQRAHGKSEGKVISFGINERFDVISWCEYAMSEFGTEVKIILFGMSMGAASVLMASELDLPENVVGIVADCPFSSPKAIIKKVLRDKKLPPALSYPFAWLGAALFGGFNLGSASAEEAVSNTDIPILLIHGEEDKLVPCYMGEAIAKNGATVTFLKFKDATHCTSILYDKEGYVNSIKNFIYKAIN